MQRLNANQLRELRPIKTFQEPKSVECLRFDSSGTHMATSSGDGIQVYSIITGQLKQVIDCGKYGVGGLTFTHRETNILHACVKDTHIRYLSLYDNQYLRCFRGHEGRVTSLEMCPRDDHFVSGCRGGSVRVWDLRSPFCEGKMKINHNHNPCLAYDPQGLVFAVGLDKQIRMYDVRNYDKGPFSTWTVEGRIGGWTRIRFSPDGSELLVSATSGFQLVDSYNGREKHYVLTDSGSCFTPDSSHVLFGKSDSTISAMDRHGKETVLFREQSSPIFHIEFNPRYMMMATCSDALSFWTPTNSRAM